MPNSSSRPSQSMAYSIRRCLLASRPELLCQGSRFREGLNHIGAADCRSGLQIRNRAGCRRREQRCYATLFRMFGDEQEVVFAERIVECQELAASGFDKLAQLLGPILRFSDHAANGLTRIPSLRDVDGHDSPPWFVLTPGRPVTSLRHFN